MYANAVLRIRSYAPVIFKLDCFPISSILICLTAAAAPVVNRKVRVGSSRENNLSFSIGLDKQIV